MKIIQFISNLGKGGAERLVTDMCNEFALQKGVEIILITYNQDKKSISFINELSKSVKHIDLKKKYKIDLLLQLKVFKFLLTEKPDVVHSHLSGTLIYLYLPILIIKKIKFYHTVHNIADEELKGDFLIFLRKLVLKTQKLNTISISSLTMKSFWTKYGYETPIIFNGIKKQQTTALLKELSEKLIQYKFNSDTKIFLSIGRINSRGDQKNFQLLIDVFKKLQYERLNVILLIIGDDTDTNQPTLKKYLSIKPENVFFLGPQNNISDYLFLVNYFCLSSKFEGLPISLIEAISHELPLIATNVGGISELIFDNQNGILVNSMEVNEYYDKIIELLNWDIEKLDKVKKFNKELYQSKFTIEANVRAHLKLYNS